MARIKARVPTSATALRALLKTAAGDYRERKERVEQAVVSWKWATGPLFSIIPFEAQRDSGPQARPLKSAPAKKRGMHEFGFDADGRLWVMRLHTESPRAAYETFVEWDEGGATTVLYGDDPKYKVPSCAARLFVTDGRPTKYLHQGPRGTLTETYHYQGNKIVCIRRKEPDQDEWIYRLEYDAKGLLSIKEKTMVIFQRRDAGRPQPRLGDLLHAIEERLYQLTPSAIRKAAERESSPFWCCALDFDSAVAWECLPPVLSLATVAERDAVPRKRRPEWRDLVWNAEAYEGLNAAYYQDAKLAALCEQANAILEQRGSGAAVSRLIVRLAKRLNEHPRKQFGKVAPEFVVYAFDRDRASTALVATCLTREQRARLRHADLL